jgi:hypothetical protein
VESVYFVTAGLISITMPSAKSEPVDVGLVRHEGVSAPLETITEQPVQADYMVQIRGKALVMPAEVFREEFRRSGALQIKVLQ